MLTKLYAGLSFLLTVGGLLALGGLLTLGADAFGDDLQALADARQWLTQIAAVLLPAGWIGLGLIAIGRGRQS